MELDKLKNGILVVTDIPNHVFDGIKGIILDIDLRNGVVDMSIDDDRYKEITSLKVHYTKLKERKSPGITRGFFYSEKLEIYHKKSKLN
ncbi:hypothetical protein P148_SR1C00001G0207 [candidate division SR1 bacterium RAAC1_SR1_1]|nr:hypothetical protein P148_SR1C00001G0207 [candidate division SR1 bacterium RAAC1_SR1_1]